MKSNKTMSVAGLAATFILYFAIGYFIPLDRFKAKDVSPESVAQEEPEQVEETPATVDETAAPSEDNSATPVIEKCSAAPLGKYFGYAVTVKASVVSGDELSYALCAVGTTNAIYSSANGSFGSKSSPVYPSDNGRYDLVVTNKRTGDTTIQTISGFDKPGKLSESQLQSYLNSDVYTDDMYRHFVDAKDQKIVFDDPEGKAHLNNIDVLGNARNANGWTFEVVPGSIQYDKYNRVRGFKVKVIE